MTRFSNGGMSAFVFIHKSKMAQAFLRGLLLSLTIEESHVLLLSGYVRLICGDGTNKKVCKNEGVSLHT